MLKKWVRLKDEFKLLNKNVSAKDLAVFTRQFAVLLNSGIAMRAVFKVMLGQTVHPALKQAALDIQKTVVLKGLPLSAALEKHKDIFSPLYVTIVKCGEKSGFLPKALNLLAENLEKEVKLRNQYLAALTYPAFIVFSSIATIILIIKYVFPSLMPFFNSFGIKLPLATRTLIYLNKFLDSWFFWVCCLLFLIFIPGFLRKFFKTSLGKKTRDEMLMSIPLVGRLTVKTVITRFCRIFSLLYSAGYPMVESLDLLRGVVDNTVYEKELKKCIERIHHGSSVAEALSEGFLFPRLVTNMISAGEATGTLEASLNNINRYYESELKYFLEQFNALIEPIIVIALGCVVAFILLAMLLPLYEVLGCFNKI